MPCIESVMIYISLDQILKASGLSLVGDAPYVHVRFVPDQKQVVKNYVRKQMGGKRYQMCEGMDFNVPMGACSCKCNISDMSTHWDEEPVPLQGRFGSAAAAA